MSPSLDMGPWISNCWMSLSTELVPCHRPESFCIHKHEVNLSLKLIHCHWCLRGAEELLDLLSCPCPGSSTFHVQQDEHLNYLIGKLGPSQAYVQAALHLEMVKVILQTCEWSGGSNLQELCCSGWWRWIHRW